MKISQDDVVSILATLGIEEICFRLEGSGDSGDIEIEDEILWKTTHPDGQAVEKMDLSQIPFGQSNLLETIMGSVEGWPDGDWVNNEGGSGTVMIRPFDTENPISIDMTYGEYEDEYNDGDEEEVELELPNSDLNTDMENIGVEDRALKI